MNFTTATYTDIGTRKKTNQDSMLVMQAQTSAGNILMAAVCDGMGGLAKGEVASAAMVNMLSSWFVQQLPGLLQKGINEQELWDQWNNMAVNANRRISEYGAERQISLGTTCAVLLIVGTYYYVMNIGDSRIYQISEKVYQLTKDQTYVQREIDAGRMTPDQARTNPKRSILLQCIGASENVIPVFGQGQTRKDEVFMLCSDGFRHMISPGEMYTALNPSVITSKAVMQRQIKALTELNIERGESDNISVILIKTC